ncbi:hypothetical protein Tco_0930173 [Tanacetum coccineum]
MGDENHIRTLGDYSKPSHEGYRNTIELPIGNNVDLPKLLDSLDLDGENRIHIHIGGSYYLIPCLILSIRKDRKTPRRYPDVPTTSWRISIRSMDSFQGLNPKSPSSWHRPLAPTGGKLRDLNVEESWALLEDLALYDNKNSNDLRDFAKPVKVITLPQDVPSTSDHRLIELENQVQHLMEAHLAPIQPTQVNKITTLCEICSSPHDTQYCMEDPEQAFVEYASSHTDEAGGKWYTFKPEQNNLGDTYNPSWKSHPNLIWRKPQNSQNNFLNPPNRFQPNGSDFMASNDARLSKFEADFKRQQGEMTNKIDTVLKAITDQIAGTLPSDTVKNPKLGTHPVSSARSYLTMDRNAQHKFTVRLTPSRSIPSNKAIPVTTKPKRMRKKRETTRKTILTILHHPIHQLHSSPRKPSNSIHSSNRSDWFPYRLTLNSFAPKRKMAT